MSRKHGSCKRGTRKNAGPRGHAASDLSAVLALVARSTITTVSRPSHLLLSDWQDKRHSSDADALVLAWIASHVQGPLHRGRLN